MATSNGLFKRIEDVTPRMFSGDVNVLLAHSRSRKNEAMTRLIDKAVSRYGSGRAADTAADDEDATAACAKWYLTSKRALVSQVGVGTVDQAMMAVLLVRHHFVRLYGLATNVVILDEIHAYDAYMSVILERLVEWLGALRTPVILLSATLPAGRRAAFANAYSKGAFGGDSTHGSSESTAYPLVFVVDREGHATKTLAQEPADHLLRVERITTTTPVNDVLPGLVELSRRGRIAWIRNTVSEAQVAWDAARGAGAEALLFHARMRARDRARVEREVLEGFGRDGNRETGLVIATQVIEQSLDLDFDLLLSDLAPIDLLMQRAGRLHRHLDSRPRPAGFDRRLRILIPPQAEVDALHFGLSRYVYDPVTMWIAHELIRTRDTVAVPRDLRALVEATYDPAERANRRELAPNAEVLLEAEGRREEARKVSEHHALSCAIPPSDYETARFRLSEDDDVDLQALTRESASAMLLLVLWDDSEGVATTIDGTALVLDPDARGAFREAELLADEQVSVPTYRVRGEATGRGDAKAYEHWLQRAHGFAQAMHMGRLTIVPMTERGGGYTGHVLDANKDRTRVNYDRSKGLWFP
jgi:CRISPR-associated endonuclease/helicase Cas3